MSRAQHRTALHSAPCPIEPTRALMNTNSKADEPRIIFTRTWEKRPGAGRREFALTAGPGSARGQRRTIGLFRAGELECPGGVPGWRSTGRRPAPGTPSREPQGCIVCSELANGHGNLGRRSRRTALATSRRGGWKVIHDYPRHFPEFLPLASSRRRPAGSRTIRPAAVIRPAPGSSSAGSDRAAGDRHGPNPRPPAQIRSNVPRGATRSSTARYFIL
jgi:hypothetical protein